MQLSIQERITRQGVRPDRHEDAGRQQRLLADRLHHGRGFPADSRRHGRRRCTGIGGMIAINRTFDEEAMRAGLKNKTLGTLLFPQDPIRHAPEIIRNLITTFPARGRLLPDRRAGEARLVLADARLPRHRDHLELGKRLRLIVLGMISALLPTQQNDLVRLNMDALGLIDLDALSVAIDAVLVDSRLAQKFVLTGRDGAAREHAARAAQLRDGGRRVQSALRAAGELPDARSASRSRSPPATTRG